MYSITASLPLAVLGFILLAVIAEVYILWRRRMLRVRRQQILSQQRSAAARRPQPTSPAAAESADDPHAELNRFARRVSASKLVAKSKLRRAYRDVLQQPQPDARSLRRLLVQHNLITAWQAEQVKEGHKEFDFGDYRLLDRIGDSVYSAEHPPTGTRVALKVFPRVKGRRKSTSIREQLDAFLADCLDHPNLVTVIDVGSDRGRHYVAMEQLAGRDLADRVEQGGPLDIASAVDRIREVANGLQYAHQHHRIHGHVQPNKLVPDDDGHIKLLGMGLRKFKTATDRGTNSQQRSLLDAYRAPEQKQRPAKIDTRTDIYSLGRVFCFLLTGVVPDTSCALREVRDEIPPELERICRRMTAPNPDDRYPSMDDVLQDLNGWLTAADTIITTGEASEGLRNQLTCKDPQQPSQPVGTFAPSRRTEPQT